MRLKWRLISIMLLANCVHLAVTASSTAVTAGNLTFSTTEKAWDPAEVPRQTTRAAYRQLVDHRDVIYIRYQDHIASPTSIYQLTLSGALERISHRIRTMGEGTIVEAQFVHVHGYIMLQADVNQHSASRELTWGVLEEAVMVLQEFTRHRPHPLVVGIWEGLNGRGLPLGQMTVSFHRDVDTA